MPMPTTTTKKLRSILLLATAVSGCPPLRPSRQNSLRCTVILDAKAVRFASGWNVQRRFCTAIQLQTALAVIGYDSGILKDATTPRWTYKKNGKGRSASRKLSIRQYGSGTPLSGTHRRSRAGSVRQVCRLCSPFRLRQCRCQRRSGPDRWPDGSMAHVVAEDLRRSASEFRSPLRQWSIAGFERGHRQKRKRSYRSFQPQMVGLSMGKTGSGRMRTKANTYDGDRWLGWFVGWAQRGDRKVVFASLNIEDWKSDEPISFATRDALIADLPKAG